MEIFIRETPQSSDEKKVVQPTLRSKRRFVNRRKSDRDRRKDKNDGVIVTLSTKEERRSRRERRQWQDPRYLETKLNPVQKEPEGVAGTGTARFSVKV